MSGCQACPSTEPASDELGRPALPRARHQLQPRQPARSIQRQREAHRPIHRPLRRPAGPCLPVDRQRGRGGPPTRASLPPVPRQRPARRFRPEHEEPVRPGHAFPRERAPRGEHAPHRGGVGVGAEQHRPAPVGLEALEARRGRHRPAVGVQRDVSLERPDGFMRLGAHAGRQPVARVDELHVLAAERRGQLPGLERDHRGRPRSVHEQLPGRPRMVPGPVQRDAQEPGPDGVEDRLDAPAPDLEECMPLGPEQRSPVVGNRHRRLPAGAVPGPLDAESRRHLHPVDREEVHSRHVHLTAEIHGEPLPGALNVTDAPAGAGVAIDEMERLGARWLAVTVQPVGGTGTKPMGCVGVASRMTKLPTGVSRKLKPEPAETRPELIESIRCGHDRRRGPRIHCVGVLDHGVGARVGRHDAHPGEIAELVGANSAIGRPVHASEAAGAEPVGQRSHRRVEAAQRGVSRIAPERDRPVGPEMEGEPAAQRAGAEPAPAGPEPPEAFAESRSAGPL